MTTYLINATMIPARYVDYRGSDPYFGPAEHDISRWHSTHATLAEAEAEYDRLAANRQCLTAILIAWEPGETMLEARLPHGNVALRSVAGGFPRETPLRHGDRSWTAYHGINQRTLAGEDWQEHGASHTRIGGSAPAPTVRARLRESHG